MSTGQEEDSDLGFIDIDCSWYSEPKTFSVRCSIWNWSPGILETTGKTVCSRTIGQDLVPFMGIWIMLKKPAYTTGQEIVWVKRDKKHQLY